MRKRARGALSPDIDPYSRETKETSIDKPIRMSRYLRWKMKSDQRGWSKRYLQPLHPQISIILDLAEHVDVDNDPQEAGGSEII